MTYQEKDIKGIIKNSANKQSNAPVVKEELVGRYDRKKTISLIRYVLQKMEDKKTPFVPLHYTLIALHNSLALLSDLESRVMTLEEVQQMGKRNMEHNDLPYETCICEIKTRRGLHICSPFWNEPQFEGDESNLEIQFSYMGTDEYDNVHVKKYGWYIRCWTSRPTDEQREATPW